MDVSGISSSGGVTQVQGPRHHGGHRQIEAKVEQAVADELGMGTDDLRSQLQSGKSLTDVASSKGVSKDDLVATIKSVLQANPPDRLPPASSSSDSSNTSSTSVSSVAATSSFAVTDADLTDLATKIADRVGGRHGHGGGAGLPALRASVATANAADLVAQLSSQSGSPNGGPDSDGDAFASFNVQL